MQQCKTTNKKTGAVRYYNAGRRVTRDAFELARFWHRVECIRRTETAHLRRDYNTVSSR